MPIEDANPTMMNKYFGWFLGKNFDWKKCLGLTAVAGVCGWFLGGWWKSSKKETIPPLQSNLIPLGAAAVAGAAAAKLVGCCAGAAKDSSEAVSRDEVNVASAWLPVPDLTSKEANWIKEHLPELMFAILVCLFLLYCICHRRKS